MISIRRKPQQDPPKPKRPEPPPKPRDEAEPNFTPEPLDPTSHPD